MKTILHTTLLACCLALSTSCIKDINDDIPEHDPVISAHCLFHSDSTWLVTVGHSSSILDEDGTDLLNGATVEVYEDGALLETLTSLEKGIYTGATLPVSGKQYQLKVTHPGYPAAEAASNMPSQITVNDFTYEANIASDQWGQKFDRFTFYLQDPPGTSDYYEYSFNVLGYYVDMGDTFWYEYPLFLRPDNADPIFGGYNTANKFENDENWNGQRHKVSLEVYAIDTSYHEEVRCIVGHCTEEYFRFVKSYESYQYNYGNPFAEPVQVYENLSGGFGIFAGNTRTITVVF